jgi:hypothetical protein
VRDCDENGGEFRRLWKLNGEDSGGLWWWKMKFDGGSRLLEMKEVVVRVC